MKVKWMSRYAEAYGKSHWFKGRVRRVVGDVATIDDGSGLTLRCVALNKLLEDRALRAFPS